MIGALVIPLIGRFAKSDTSRGIRDVIAVAFSGLAVVFAIFMIPSASTKVDYQITSIPWIPVIGLYAGVYVDPLSVFVANVAADIGFLIMLYSIGYMKKEEDMGRYWFFMLFFIGGMILLVMADNLLQMFLGWEIVGTCSWGLIGYWYKKSRDYDDPWIGQMAEGDYNAHAGMKAFITTRIGDIALLTAILLIFVSSGTSTTPPTFNYADLAKSGATWASSLASAGLLIPVALMFFAGPIGKSAQFPLDVWLMEAMAGPTTVSALIHAAAMVKAGVYLVARFLPIFLIAALGIPGASVFPMVVAGIGAFTAFLAATMGTVQREIKKVLACSTISQLGFMFMALGVGGLLPDFQTGPGYAAGTLQLAVHAIFKALLFLGAGAVLHSVESIYMDDMGGLRKRMPITFICMLVGVLSLSGIPPFAGFFSKESIFDVLWAGGQGNIFIMIVFVMAAVTAIFTVFYSFRMIGLAFFGPESKHIKELEHEGHEVHEAPKIMWIPLVILAAFTVFFGFLGPLFDSYITGTPAVSLIAWLTDIFVSPTFMITLIIITVGFIPAFFLYIRRSIAAEKPAKRGGVLGGLRKFFFNRWYINAFYYKVFVNGFLSLCRKIRGTVEEKGIDRFNYRSARGFGRISNALRKIHTGILTVNLIYIVVGVLLFLLILLLA
jgi:NADH-quinone oxidoreductase subunit L